MAGRTWKRALVTGASAGIGRSIACRLAAAGTDLVIVARNRDKLDALATELGEQHRVHVDVMAADLGDRAQLARVEQRVAAEEEPIDLLVNNAGFGFSGSFGAQPLEQVQGEIDVNIVALMRLSHVAIARMKDGGGGGILNVSSTASFQPGPGSANYAATKAYVSSLSQSLHEENRRHDITVTALCPGLTRTEFQERGNHNVGTPDFTWQDADEVAKVGLSAVSSGRCIVVSGLFNKGLQVASRLAPMSVSRWGSAQAYKLSH